jgi:hypothetical protein
MTPASSYARTMPWRLTQGSPGAFLKEFQLIHSILKSRVFLKYFYFFDFVFDPYIGVPVNSVMQFRHWGGSEGRGRGRRGLFGIESVKSFRSGGGRKGSEGGILGISRDRENSPPGSVDLNAIGASKTAQSAKG